MCLKLNLAAMKAAADGVLMDGVVVGERLQEWFRYGSSEGYGHSDGCRFRAGQGFSRRGFHGEVKVGFGIGHADESVDNNNNL